MPTAMFTHTLDNGLTLLGEPMATANSVALAIDLPAGAAAEPDDLAGASAVGAEWLLRGAGDRDSRALNDALDSLGLQHSASAGHESLHLSAVLLGRYLDEALAIYGDILRRPRLTPESFEPCRQLIAQDLQGLEDQPARKALALIGEKFFPWPLGRMTLGRDETLQAMTAQAAADHLNRLLTPAGAILAVTGNFDWPALRDRVEALLGDWTGSPPPAVEPGDRADGMHHIRKESSQTHITLACHAPPLAEEACYYPTRVAQAVLSMGMGSRLFTEVREKRALAYAVKASYSALTGQAGLFAYAGTRPELAQQSLDVTLAEIRRLANGVDDEELSRAKTQLRAALVMKGQSTLTRATSLASDFRHLGRLRTLDELNDRIQAVTHDDIRTALAAWPAEDVTILTVGPEPLADPTQPKEP